MNSNVSQKISALLKEQNLDLILVTDPYNLRYLTTFAGEGIAVLSKDLSYVITDSRYTLVCRQTAGSLGFQVIEVSVEHGFLYHLTDIVKRSGAKTIGFEDLSISFTEYNRYTEGLAKAAQEGTLSYKITWLKLGNALDALRMIKTPEEVAKMRKAAHIADAALAKLLNKIHVGMTELEVAATLEYEMKMAGAEGLAFDTIAASGLHSASPHAVPDSKRLEDGDFLTMDFGCKYEGYCSDMTRTIVMGKANSRQKEVYELVLKAQLSAEKALKAGVKGKDIDKIARDIIAEGGYDGYFGHGLGHSVGLFIHEEPRLSVREERIIQAGMIETVEPGIYVPDFGGVRIEDMVLVTEDGIDILCESPKELLEIC